MFFKEFNETSTNLSKYFRSKRTIYETATLFDQLSLTQDLDNPFESAIAGLAQFGALQCFSKVQDTAKTVQTAVSAARLFMKSADFSYSISRCIKETWAVPLADAMHCYRVAIEVLKANNKPYLASQILMELGNVELRFDMIHNAANTFEEATDVIIEGKAPLPLLFNAATASIGAYNRVDRYDLALAVLDKAQTHFFDNETAWVSPSPLMKRQYHDILIYRAVLLMMTFKHDEAIQYSQSNLDPLITEVLKQLIEATKNHQIYQIDLAIDRAKEIKKFSPPHLNLFDRHLQMMSRSVENGFAIVMG